MSNLRNKFLLAISEVHSGNGSEGERIADAVMSVVTALSEDDAAVKRIKAAVNSAAILDMRTERLASDQIFVTPVLTNPSGIARAAIRAMGGE